MTFRNLNGPRAGTNPAPWTTTCLLENGFQVNREPTECDHHEHTGTLVVHFFLLSLGFENLIDDRIQHSEHDDRKGNVDHKKSPFVKVVETDLTKCDTLLSLQKAFRVTDLLCLLDKNCEKGKTSRMKRLCVLKNGNPIRRWNASYGRLCFSKTETKLVFSFGKVFRFESR